jgi:hypothetical protein
MGENRVGLRYKSPSDTKLSSTKVLFNVGFGGCADALWFRLTDRRRSQLAERLLSDGGGECGVEVAG